jgi:hypothetical protein
MQQCDSVLKCLAKGGQKKEKDESCFKFVVNQNLNIIWIFKGFHIASETFFHVTVWRVGCQKSCFVITVS